MLNRGVAELFPDDRQQTRANPVPNKSGIAIRRILAPALAPIAQKCLQCGPPETEQRPHHFAKSASLLFENDARINAGETPNPGTAKNTQEHCLRLIVESVGRRDFRNLTFACQPAKKLVA